MFRKIFYNSRIILVATAIIILFSKVLILFRIGDLGWEPDEYMHLLEVKTLFSNFPENISMGLSVWAKPLYIYPYGLIASIFNFETLLPFQIIGAILILISSILVYKILRKLWASFLVGLSGLILTNFSFILFRSSLSSMTEPIFTLFLISGFYLFLEKRYKLSSLLIGLSVLGRIEGLLYVLIWFGALYVIKELHLKNIRKSLSYILILILPTFIWNLLGFIQTGRLFYLISNGYPTERGAYGFGKVQYYIEGFLKQEPLLFILFLLSLFLLIRYFKARKTAELLASVIFILTLIIQTILWTFGLFGTAGLMRYFIPVIPFLVIIVMLFVDELIKKFEMDRWERYITLSVIIFTQIFFTLILFVRGGMAFGLASYPYIEPGSREAGIWVRENIDSNVYISSDKPEIIYYSGRDLNTSTIFYRERFYSGEKGIYIWTKDWGPSVTKISLEEMYIKARFITSFNDYAYIFEI